MSNGSKVLIYLSLYLSASISRIVDSNPQGLISSFLLIETNLHQFSKFLFIVKVALKPRNSLIAHSNLCASAAAMLHHFMMNVHL